MERVFKREGMVFKILPCMLISMFVIMCLYGSNVYASQSFISDTGDTIITNDKLDNEYEYFLIIRRYGTYKSNGISHYYYDYQCFYSHYPFYLGNYDDGVSCQVYSQSSDTSAYGRFYIAVLTAYDGDITTLDFNTANFSYYPSPYGTVSSTGLDFEYFSNSDIYDVSGNVLLKSSNNNTSER